MPINCPLLLEGTVRKLLDHKGSGMLKGTRPKGAADYLNYKITLEEGHRNSVIECNQFDMDDDLKSLIRYVENRITEGKIVHNPSIHVVDGAYR